MNVWPRDQMAGLKLLCEGDCVLGPERKLFGWTLSIWLRTLDFNLEVMERVWDKVHTKPNSLQVEQKPKLTRWNTAGKSAKSHVHLWMCMLTCSNDSGWGNVFQQYSTWKRHRYRSIYKLTIFGGVTCLGQAFQPAGCGSGVVSRTTLMLACYFLPLCHKEECLLRWINILLEPSELFLVGEFYSHGLFPPGCSWTQSQLHFLR